jgi:putative endonuclease
MWYLYIIKKKDRYYAGITTDLKDRLRQHSSPPLLYRETFSDKFQAARREREIKGWSRAKKEQLIAEFSR